MIYAHKVFIWAVIVRLCFTHTQLEYAARDAYVGVFAFWRMISMKITGNSSITGASVDNATTKTTSLFCACTAQHWAKALSFCQGLLDVDYKSVASASRPTSATTANTRPSHVLQEVSVGHVSVTWYFVIWG